MKNSKETNTKIVNTTDNLIEIEEYFQKFPYDFFSVLTKTTIEVVDDINSFNSSFSLSKQNGNKKEIEGNSNFSCLACLDFQVFSDILILYENKYDLESKISDFDIAKAIFSFLHKIEFELSWAINGFIYFDKLIRKYSGKLNKSTLV